MPGIIPELGYGATVAALALAAYGSGASAAGALTGRPALGRSSERAALGVWVLITCCMLLMVYAVYNDLARIDVLRFFR